MGKKTSVKLAKLATLILSLTFAVATIFGGLYLVKKEVLMQDFHVELKMGSGYGSISGMVKAHAIDFETLGSGNSVTIQLSPQDDESHSISASRESGNLSVIAYDRGEYYARQFMTNGSSVNLVCPADCEIVEVRLTDVDSYLNTSHIYAPYDITFRAVENTIVPQIEIRREHDWHPAFQPYLSAKANGDSSILSVFGANLSISVDGSNQSFTGVTYVSIQNFDDAFMSWTTTGSFQYGLFPGTEATISEPTQIKLGNLTGFVKSLGSTSLVSQGIEGEGFRWVRIWATEWTRPWNEWVFMELLHGKLWRTSDGSRDYCLNTVEVTRPSDLFQDEETQSTFFLATGSAIVVAQMVFALLSAIYDREDVSSDRGEKKLPNRRSLREQRLRKKT